MKTECRQLLYSVEFPEGRIFEKDEEIPQGYVDHPGKIAKDPPKKKRGRPRKTE